MQALKRLSSRLSNGNRRSSRGRKRVRHAAHYAPRVESLESRRLLAASVFEVTNINNSGEGSLREAILAANAQAGPDVIRFDSSLSGQTIRLSSDGINAGEETLSITDDLTIEGLGKDELTIDGAGLFRVFAVLPEALISDPFVSPTADQVATSPTVSISGLTVANGLASDALGYQPPFVFGGGLYNLGGTVELSKMGFRDNVALGFLTAGGAVANEFGGTLTVTQSHFTRNASAGALIGVGGAITSDLGELADGSQTDQPNVSIDRSTFDSNIASAQLGYIDDEETGAFSGLAAGGAILNVTGLMSISRSSFISNSAFGGSSELSGDRGGPAYGGAINSGDISPFGIADSKLEVSRSEFIGNAAIGGFGSDTDGGAASGGAIVVNNLGDAQLSRNTFDENSVTGGDADGIGNGGVGNGGALGTAGGADVQLSRNLFVNNTAQGGVAVGASAAGRGGAIGSETILNTFGFVPLPATVSIDRDQIEHNSATGAGGGIYNEGELSISRARIANNEVVWEPEDATEPEVVTDFFPGYLFRGAALGGGIANGGFFVVDQENETPVAVYGSVEMSHTELAGNSAIGASDVEGPNTVADQFAGIESIPTYPGIGVGGGLHSLGEVDILRSRITDNRAVGGNGNAGSFAGVANGGGLYNDGLMKISHSQLSGNVAVGGSGNEGDINAGGGYGGGITSGTVTALPDIELRSASLEIRHTKLIGNEATGGDGNSLVALPIPTPQIHRPAGAFGAGVNVYQGTADISKSMIANNVSRAGESGDAGGAGVAFFGFVGTVEANLSDSLVMNNLAYSEDGESLGAGISSGALGSLFAVRNGSAVVTASISRVLIFGNRAEAGEGGRAYGGGIYNDSESDLTLERSKVFKNQAVAGPGGEGIGGGIYSQVAVDLIHSKVFKNFASTSDDDCFGC